MEKLISIYSNGEWIVSSNDSKLEVFNPWNNETLATLVEPTVYEIDQVIQNSVETFRAKKLNPDQRFEILSKVAALLKERKTEVAAVISKDNGKPIRDAEIEVLRAAKAFQDSAEEAKRIHGYTEELLPPAGADYSLGLTVREPVGVVCAITPFNFPLALAAHKIAPAIAAGNTVIFKPSEQTTRTGELLVNLLAEAGLPNGFLNMLVGTGKNVGDVLLDDERINFYSFTGSAKVGLHIKNRSGFRRVALELGSNAPNIVHHDADLEQAVKTLVKASFAYAGQVCISSQRIYVHSDIALTFMDRFVQLTKELQLGDPMLTTTDVGPVINQVQAERIESWIKEAVAEGAKILYGGDRNGSIITPTIIVEADSTSKVMCEEIFGPVVNIQVYDDLDELVEKVNTSKYGLQAGVFTSNIHTAMDLARRCHVGGVNINNASISRADSMPYGGVKQSGIGKEGPRFTIEEMTDVKVITISTTKA
ncbi:aldehyde dehydrogenase family protein [Bacillus sp. 03113]|uniref:aldehyde dehydrogenase family protein n=1 Tax=Bacillus sp. 03113 TaxID=2578211 RepID=UPI0011448EE2|nr:aldehyde dehydrogenase family protein [Bacillus sp. 03113]